MINKACIIISASRFFRILACILVFLSSSANNPGSTTVPEDITTDSLLKTGWLFLNAHQTKKAFECATVALNNAKATENKSRLKSCYQLLQAISVAENDYKHARENFMMFIIYRDSLIKEDNTRKKVQSEMQFEFDKKQEADKLMQDKINLMHATQARHQNIILIIVITGLGIIITFSIFLFKRFRLITMQKNIIQSQKEEVEIQKNISDERRVLAEKQGEIIQEKQKEILDSIRYAKRIQTALIPSDKYIDKTIQNLKRK